MTETKKNKKQEEKKSQSLKNETFEQEKESLKKEIADLRNKYLRALADYQNLERRVEEERKKFQYYAVKEILLKFLEVLDLIEKAEVFIKDEGLKLVKERFLKILKEEGVREIEILGKEFDPNVAECIEVVEGEEEGKVVEVVRKGYFYHNQVLRIARVKVGKKVKS